MVVSNVENIDEGCVSTAFEHHSTDEGCISVAPRVENTDEGCFSVVTNIKCTSFGRTSTQFYATRLNSTQIRRGLAPMTDIFNIIVNDASVGANISIVVLRLVTFNVIWDRMFDFCVGKCKSSSVGFYTVLLGNCVVFHCVCVRVCNSRQSEHFQIEPTQLIPHRCITSFLVLCSTI